MAGGTVDQWELRPGRLRLAGALAAAALLAGLGAFVGGPVGWTACAFFVVACLVVGGQLARRAPLARLDGEGITLLPRGGSVTTTAWPEVAGVVLWSSTDTDGQLVDVLGVAVAATGEPAPPPAPGGSGAELPRAELTVRHAVALAGCALDVDRLRDAVDRLPRHHPRPPVVDQRHRAGSRKRAGHPGRRPAARSSISATWRGRSRPRS